jgi:predicted amidohydrolase
VLCHVVPLTIITFAVRRLIWISIEIDLTLGARKSHPLGKRPGAETRRLEAELGPGPPPSNNLNSTSDYDKNYRSMFRALRLRTLRHFLTPKRSIETWDRGIGSRGIANMVALLKKPVKIALVQLASGVFPPSFLHGSPPCLSPPIPLSSQHEEYINGTHQTGADKAHNLSHARDKVLEASRAGAQIVVLPECFNSPYGTSFFPKYAETLLPSPPTEEQSPSFHALSEMAKEASVYLVGGSIPEREVKDGAEKLFNTSLTFDRAGKLLATHRKVHLFDIDIPGGITFRESEVLSPGNKVTLVDFPEYGKVGVAICYDVRFPELAMIASRKGAFALVYPGAFNTTTGPLHWRLLAQGRAVDNQVYVAMCSPARDEAAGYKAWGHSLVADPMGKVMEEADEGEEIM